MPDPLPPATALRRAIFARLDADPALRALLGPGRVFDDAPPGARPPFLRFADHRLSDWSSDREEGEAHELDLEIQAAPGGRAAAESMLAATRAALAGLSAIEPPGRLVMLRFAGARTTRAAGEDRFLATASFRALIETA